MRTWFGGLLLVTAVALATVTGALAGKTAHETGRLSFASQSALVKRVHRLRGTRIAILVWASWCPPCVRELPLVETASERYRKQVTFLDADDEDTIRGVRALKRSPVISPVYETKFGLGGIVRKPPRGIPAMVFIDRSGKVSYVRVGEYLSSAAIDRDIKNYALNG